MGNKLAQQNKMTRVNTRLFTADVIEIKKLAELRGIPWQIELRLLVRRAMKGEQREVLILKEHRGS